MTAGLPSELTPFDVWQAAEDAVRTGTTLVALDDEPFSGNTTPGPLVHRSFRVEPGNADYTARGEDFLTREDIAIALRHDYDPGAHKASYKLASADFVAMFRAVLSTSAPLFRIGQPVPVRRTCRRVGGHIEQTLVIRVQYTLSTE